MDPFSSTQYLQMKEVGFTQDKWKEVSRKLKQQEAVLALVKYIQERFLTEKDMPAAYNQLGAEIRDLFQAQKVCLALYDLASESFNFPYTYGEKNQTRVFLNALIEKVFISRAPILINQNLAAVFPEIKVGKKWKWEESSLAVPIMVEQEARGVIIVQNSGEETLYSEDDQALLVTVATHLGLAIRHREADQKLHFALLNLQTARKQLLQQEKLASLGKLSAGIAHEIKNPLNFVNNFSDLNVELIEEVFESFNKLEKNEIVDEVREILQDVNLNLKKIHQHGSRADSIVKSMLLHSRGGSGTLEPTDLNGLIREYVNLSFHGMRAGKNPINVGIDLELDEELGLVSLIGEDFSRVILNLCSNAFDAMREKLLSNRTNGEYTPRILIRTSREGGQVKIDIKDNGPGIPAEYKDKILQPFFTTKKATEGTGLGLAITQDIIKAHKGTLKICTQENSFTQFTILLPIPNKEHKT